MLQNPLSARGLAHCKSSPETTRLVSVTIYGTISMTIQLHLDSFYAQITLKKTAREYAH